MADRRVRTVPGGKNCYCVFTVTVKYKQSHVNTQCSFSAAHAIKLHGV